MCLFGFENLIPFCGRQAEWAFGYNWVEDCNLLTSFHVHKFLYSSYFKALLYFS